MFSNPKIQQYTWLIDIALMVAGLTVFYFLWAGSYPLFTPDEGRYSEVAREMIAAHNYITPNLNGVAFLDKPILYYWLQVSAIKVFGLKEWALRLWPMLLGIFCCLMTYVTGRILFNRRTGILAALVLASNPLYFGSSHYANLDLEVAVMIASSLFFFMIGIERTHQSPEKKHIAPFIFAYFFAGLAFLTKGLIGIVFPIMIIGTWAMLLKRWQTVVQLRFVMGFFIFVALVAPWYFLVQQTNPQFFHFFFITQQFARFLTIADFNNQSSRWFYLPIVGLGFLPWTLFLIQACIHQCRLVYQNKQHHRCHLFLLLWAAIIFIFFSIPRSKTIGYILPIFPALALMVGNYFSTHWEKLTTLGLKAGMAGFIVFCVTISILCLAAPHISLFRVPWPLIRYLSLTALIAMGAGAASYYFLRTQQFKAVMYTLFVTAFVLLWVLIASATAINQKSIKPLALRLNTLLQKNDEVVTYYKYFQDLPIYIQRQIIVVANWHSDTIPHYDNWQRELWFGMPYKDTSSWLIEEPSFWLRWHGNHRMYAIMYTNYYPDFRYKAHNKVYELAIDHDFVLVTNQKPIAIVNG